MYRSLDWNGFVKASINAVKTTAMVLLIIGAAAAFGWLPICRVQPCCCRVTCVDGQRVDRRRKARRAGYSRAFTRRRSAGSTSASNQGFFLSQVPVRQLGCGVGKNAGPYSRQARTVSVTVFPRALPR